MTDRDMKTHPYTQEERRVVDYLIKATKGVIGAGPDPIGFLIASHDYLKDMHQFEPGSPESIRARMEFTMHFGTIGKLDAAMILYNGAPGYALSVGPDLKDEEPNEYMQLMLAVITRADDAAWRKSMIDFLDGDIEKKIKGIRKEAES